MAFMTCGHCCIGSRSSSTLSNLQNMLLPSFRDCASRQVAGRRRPARRITSICLPSRPHQPAEQPFCSSLN